jgi:hypothetical protein
MDPQENSVETSKILHLGSNTSVKTSPIENRLRKKRGKVSPLSDCSLASLNSSNSVQTDEKNPVQNNHLIEEMDANDIQEMLEPVHDKTSASYV